MMKKQIISMAVLLALAFSMSVPAEEITPSVTVQGSGRVTVTPDLGTISFGITEEGKEAGEVQETLTEKANAVKDAVLEEGLPEDQFSTAGIQLYTVYDYSSETEKVTGYRGQVSMSIDEIGVDEVGKYLGILSENGVNEIEGIRVFFSGYEDAYNEALGKAMLEARKKAETIAGAENAGITGQFSAVEGYEDTSMRAAEKNLDGNYAMGIYDEAGMDTGSSLDFSVGTTEIEAKVTVCYEIEYTVVKEDR